MEGNYQVQFLKKQILSIAGDKMGPSKRIKAEDLGVAIMTEDDFLLMIL